jgi:NAD(P)-dependent dehydrogenase (short-subunit alcohol dehydrogenase family)
MTGKTSLTGKYAIVTGSSQGLGEAIAWMFEARGAAGLIICGRNAERGKAIADDLYSDTGQVHFVQADLAAVEDCLRIVTAADEYGLEKAEQGRPFGRLLNPEEVARAVAFLPSEESGMMTSSIVDFAKLVQGAGSQPIPPAETM